MPGADRSDRVSRDALDRYWDRLTTGAAEADPRLDPDLAAAVRRFRAADDAPPPPAALASSTWQQLMGSRSAEHQPARVGSLPLGRNHVAVGRRPRRAGGPINLRGRAGGRPWK